MRRSIICCLLIASLIICSSNVCFANPLDPWSDVETQIVTSGVQDIVSDVDTIRVALSTLYSYLTNNGDGVIEGLLVIANRISNIINTLDYYVPREYAILQDVYSFLAPHAGSNQDIWNLVNTIVTNTNAISTGQLGIAQDVYNISGYTNAIQSKLTTLNQTEISSLAKLTNIDNNLQSLEFINWNDLTNYFDYSFSTDNINYYPIDQFVTNSYTEFYLKIHKNSNFNIYQNNLIRIYVPFYLNYRYMNYDVTIIDYDYDTNLFIDRHTFYSYLYFYPINFIYDNNRPELDFVIKFSNVYNTKFFKSGNIYLNGLNNDSTEFYTVVDFIKSASSNESTNIEDIKNILMDIDNNSDFIQNNNDLQINVDIDPSVGQGVTGVISKIQDLLDFGISLQEFLVVLNQFDNLNWFTRLETYEQVNYDPRDNVGYQNLYD